MWGWQHSYVLYRERIQQQQLLVLAEALERDQHARESENQQHGFVADIGGDLVLGRLGDLELDE